MEAPDPCGGVGEESRCVKAARGVPHTWLLKRNARGAGRRAGLIQPVWAEPETPRPTRSQVSAAAGFGTWNETNSTRPDKRRGMGVAGEANGSRLLREVWRVENVLGIWALQPGWPWRRRPMSLCLCVHHMREFYSARALPRPPCGFGRCRHCKKGTHWPKRVSWGF